MPPRNITGGYSQGGGHPAFRNRVNQGQGYAMLYNPVMQLIRQESRQMSSAAMHRVDTVPRTGGSMNDRVRNAGTYPGADGDKHEREMEEKEASGESGKKILSPERTTDLYRQFVLNMDADTARRDEKIRKQKRKRMQQQQDSSSDSSSDDDDSEEKSDDSEDEYKMEPASPIKVSKKKSKQKKLNAKSKNGTEPSRIGAAGVPVLPPQYYVEKKKKKKSAKKIPYLV